jgi:outer membrane murein-binding lipoprotein Lpp
VGSIDQLAFPAPQSEAALELARLIDSRAELESKLDALDREQYAAGEEVTRLSDELTSLERRSLEGESVTPAQRSKAEGELAKARSVAASPWGERRQAVTEAIHGHQGRVGAFVAEHFAELVEEVEADGAEAARAVDAAAASLVAAYHDRDRASQRLDALIATVNGRSNFGDVTPSRSESITREAEKLLASGGEAAPRVRDELRSWDENDSQVEEAVSA